MRDRRHLVRTSLAIGLFVGAVTVLPGCGLVGVAAIAAAAAASGGGGGGGGGSQSGLSSAGPPSPPAPAPPSPPAPPPAPPPASPPPSPSAPPSPPAPPKPQVTSVTPAIGSTAGGDLLTFTGSNFDGNTTILLDGRVVTSLNVTSATSATGVAPAPTNYAPGFVIAKAQNLNGATTTAKAYHYGIVMLSVSVAGGPTGGGTAITITGTGFTSSTVFRIGGGVCPGTVQSTTTFTGASPSGIAGWADVTGQDPNGGYTMAKAFFYGAPTVTSIAPAAGFTGGGTKVTISGTGFTAGTTATIGGSALTNVAVLDRQTLTGTTPARAAGFADVVVTNGGGASAPIVNGFEYRALVVDAMDPFLIRGGTVVTIKGGGFDPTPANNVVSFGGQAGTVTAASATQLTVTAPASPTAGNLVVTVGGSSTAAWGYEVGPLGVNGFFPALSRDGRRVAFRSHSPLDPNHPLDRGVFVRDLVTGTTTLASVTSANVAASDGGGGRVALSADGRVVVFESSATNLVPNDPTLPVTSADIFVTDLATGETLCASVGQDGRPANSVSEYPSVSADGRYVSFMTLSSLVPEDTNGAYDNYVFDRTTRTVALGGVTAAGGPVGSVSFTALSADGRYLAFITRDSTIVPNDTNAAEDVFVRDRQTGTTTRVSVGAAGGQADQSSSGLALSADGRFVVFYTAAQFLVAGDTNNVEDVFVHDRQTATTTRVSTDSAGVEANGRSQGAESLSISDDDRYVAFYSEATNLPGGAGTGPGHSFVKDRVTGSLVRIDLTTNGLDFGSGRGAVLSGDGFVAAFELGSGIYVTPR